MKVFILEGGWEYEGSDILGVFSNKEKGESKLKIYEDFKSKSFEERIKSELTHTTCDYYSLTEYEVED